MEGGRGPIMEASGSESEDAWDDAEREGLVPMTQRLEKRDGGNAGEAGEAGEEEKRRLR